MEHSIKAAIYKARWKARIRHVEQFIIRYRREDGSTRFRSITLSEMLKRIKVGESPLCIFSVMPDGLVRSWAKEFDHHEFNHHQDDCGRSGRLNMVANCKMDCRCWCHAGGH